MKLDFDALSGRVEEKFPSLTITVEEGVDVHFHNVARMDRDWREKLVELQKPVFEVAEDEGDEDVSLEEMEAREAKRVEDVKTLMLHISDNDKNFGKLAKRIGDDAFVWMELFIAWFEAANAGER